MYHHDDGDVIPLGPEDLNDLISSDNDTDWDDDPYYRELTALTQAIELWQVSDDRSTPDALENQDLLDWTEIAAQMTVTAGKDFQDKPYTANDCMFMWVQWVNPDKNFVKGEKLIITEDDDDTVWEDYESEEEDPKSKEPLKYCFYPEEPTLATRLRRAKVSYPADLQYPDEVKILSSAYFGSARRRSRQGGRKGERRAYHRPKSLLGNLILRNPMCYVKNTDDNKGWKNFDFIAKHKQVEKEDYEAMLAQEAIDKPQAAIDRAAAAAAAAQQAMKKKQAVKRKKKEPPKEKALPVTFDELMAVSEIAKAPVKVTDNW